MKSRGGHAGKSQFEKDLYVQRARATHNDPTASQDLAFAQSDDLDEDFSQPTSSKRRPVALWPVIKYHFKEHWSSWLVTAVIAVLGWFAFTLRDTLTEHTYKLETTKNDVSDLKEQSKEIQKKQNDQDLKIQRSEIRIDNLEKTKQNVKPH